MSASAWAEEDQPRDRGRPTPKAGRAVGEVAGEVRPRVVGMHRNDRVRLTNRWTAPRCLHWRQCASSFVIERPVGRGGNSGSSRKERDAHERRHPPTRDGRTRRGTGRRAMNASTPDPEHMIVRADRGARESRGPYEMPMRIRARRPPRGDGQAGGNTHAAEHRVRRPRLRAETPLERGRQGGCAGDVAVFGRPQTLVPERSREDRRARS